jgi:hypothetical protein
MLSGGVSSRTETGGQHFSRPPWEADIRGLYIETVVNRKSSPFILLCEFFRQEGKVKHRTLPPRQFFD